MRWIISKHKSFLCFLIGGYCSDKVAFSCIWRQGDYLERLAIGEHTLTAEFTDGEASAEFTIVAVGSSGSATQKTNSAVTGDSRNTGVRKTYGVRSGDESNTGAMLVLIFASLAFIAAVLIRYKKSRKKY